MRLIQNVNKQTFFHFHKDAGVLFHGCFSILQSILKLFLLFHRHMEHIECLDKNIVKNNHALEM